MLSKQFLQLAADGCYYGISHGDDVTIFAEVISNNEFCLGLNVKRS